MFGSGQKKGTSKAAAKPAKLHSIAAMLVERGFGGRFDVGDVSYGFILAPEKAAVSGGKLQLSGSFTVFDKRSNIHDLKYVPAKATLIAAQGGIGTAPPRKKLPADISPPRPDLPIVESTGSLSFCGVLYFKLAPLDGRALGVPADMTRLQLNVRLAPVNDVGRGLQAAFSSIVDALYGQPVDANAAEPALSDLNKLLAGS